MEIEPVAAAEIAGIAGPEPQSFCFICTTSILGDSSSSRHVPENVEFICKLLDLMDSIDRRKFSNLVLKSRKYVYYCNSCAEMVLGLKVHIDQLNLLKKRVDGAQRSIHGLFVNALPNPNQGTNGWTSKLRNFLIRALNDCTSTGIPVPSLTSKILGTNPPSSTSTSTANIPEVDLKIESVNIDHESIPDPDPEWYPESDSENEQDPAQIHRDRENEILAIKPCFVRVSRLQISKTLPRRFIVPEEMLVNKKKSSKKRFQGNLLSMNICTNEQREVYILSDLQGNGDNISEIRKVRKRKFSSVIEPKSSKRKLEFKGDRINCSFPNCPVSFVAQHPELLTFHIRKIHEGKEKPYICGQCSEEFYTIVRLQKHRVENKHRKKMILNDIREQRQRLQSKFKRKLNFKGPRINCTVPNCIASFSAARQDLLTVHNRKIHEGKDKPYICGQCSEEFSTFLQLRKHRLETQHRKSNEKFTLKSKLPKPSIPRIDHYQSVKKVNKNPGKLLNCTYGECKATFSHQKPLNYHIRKMHEGLPNPYNCSKCPKEFPKLYLLNEHIAQSSHKTIKSLRLDGEEYSCTCGRFFVSKKILDEHVTSQGGACKNPLGFGSYIDPDMIAPKRFICGVCSKRFSSRKLLRYHLLKHTSERNHICNICGNVYKAKATLRKHQYTIHTQAFLENHENPLKVIERIKKLTCEVCNKTSTTPSQAKAHRLTHSDSTTPEYRFYCPTCNLGFNWKQGLNAHIQVHNATLDFICEQCGKEFKRKDKMQIHIKRVHEAVKNTICEHCSKSFFDMFALNRHIKIVHEARTKSNQFHCIPCDKLFPTKGYLSIHQKTPRHEKCVQHIMNAA